MRITTSYRYHKNCEFADCYRIYCSIHRYLYDWCDGAEQDAENDRKFYSDGNCTHCQMEYRRRKYATA